MHDLLDLDGVSGQRDFILLHRGGHELLHNDFLHSAFEDFVLHLGHFHIFELNGYFAADPFSQITLGAFGYAFSTAITAQMQ